MNSFEIIHFQFAGLNLQEPMALVTNWLIFTFCFFVFFTTNWSNSNSSIFFKKFYLFLGISTFFGGLGHIFFQYTGFYGKYPSWIFGVLASFFVSKGIIFYIIDKKIFNFWNNFLYIKSFSLLALSLILQKFVFVAIDAILSYLIYSGFIAWILNKKGNKEMKYFVFGMFVLLPSAFIFLMNINIHRYLNRDDLSHLLMLTCSILFYIGIKKSNNNYLIITKVNIN